MTKFLQSGTRQIAVECLTCFLSPIFPSCHKPRFAVVRSCARFGVSLSYSSPSFCADSLSRFWDDYIPKEKSNALWYAKARDSGASCSMTFDESEYDASQKDCTNSCSGSMGLYAGYQMFGMYGSLSLVSIPPQERFTDMVSNMKYCLAETLDITCEVGLATLSLSEVTIWCSSLNHMLTFSLVYLSSQCEPTNL